MKLLLSPDAPTERGADYTDAFAGIDAIEGQGLENPMGSASPAPVAPQAPTPTPTPTPEPQAATPVARPPRRRTTTCSTSTSWSRPRLKRLLHLPKHRSRLPRTSLRP